MEDFQKDLVDTFEKLRGSSDPKNVMAANKAIDKIESNETISKKKKKETREATGAASAGPYSGVALFSEPTSDEINDKVSGKVPEVRENESQFTAPKLTMFSDESKQYKIKEEILKGGVSDNKSIQDLAKKHTKSKVGHHLMTNYLKKQLDKGIKVEMEHTANKNKAKEIAMDHLAEKPDYYDKLEKIESKEKKIETKEATGSGSAGSYSQPSIWAKSTNKKDWAAARKTQIPGGKFVTVKKKCKTFPYCNQGDIKAIKLWENETMKKVITNICNNTGLDENTIKAIIQYELEISGKLL